MEEYKPNEVPTDPERVGSRREFLALIESVAGDGGRFAFPGINPDAYQKLKKDDEEFPGMVTPIDVLIQKFSDEGMKVVVGDDPQSGNVFVIPAISGDPTADALKLQHLSLESVHDRRIRALILGEQDWVNLK